MKDITYVIHIASPFPLVQPKDENEVITPAVEGTQAILKACVQAKSVKKVVMTSSSVAVHCKYSKTFYHSGSIFRPLGYNPWPHSNVFKADRRTLTTHAHGFCNLTEGQKRNSA